MSSRVLLLGLLVAAGGNTTGGRKGSSNRFGDKDEFDAVAVTRCDIVCQNETSKLKDKEKCHDKCLDSSEMKPGECPHTFEGLPIFAQACVDACSQDSQCPGTEKCCAHSCGVTCQPAMGLNEVEGLLPVPKNVSARELRGPSVVEIQWLLHPSPKSWDSLFLIEARSHFGKFYNEESLDSWIPMHQASESPAILNGLVLPARWYIFRVCAVNINGTRGFSKPSEPFFLSRPPAKPGRPKRLAISNIREVDGSVWAELKWGRPRSDVPLRRYKIYWSRRLPGHSSHNSTDNVIMHQRSVPKSQQHFQLKNLEKNELYFIQVQGMAVFGREKLKGAKAELFFNTTRPADPGAVTSSRRRRL